MKNGWQVSKMKMTTDITSKVQKIPNCAYSEMRSKFSMKSISLFTERYLSITSVFQASLINCPQSIANRLSKNLGRHFKFR